MKTLVPFALALTTLAAPSAIVWSGNVDIPIPAVSGSVTTLNGVFVDLESGFFQNAADNSFLLTDVNFIFGGASIRSDDDFRPVRMAADASSPVVNLLPGSMVDFTLTFGPSGVGTSNAHLGTGPGRFQDGVPGYLGFLYSDNGGPTRSGWMRVTLTNNGNGVIHEWAINDTAEEPVIVGVIPEPSCPLLVSLSLGAVILRRRRFC